MSILRTSTLALALLAAAGVATPAFAQRAGEARAKVGAKVSKSVAADAARNARHDARIAKGAERDAMTHDVDADDAEDTAEAAHSMGGKHHDADKDAAPTRPRATRRAAAGTGRHGRHAHDGARSAEAMTPPMSENASENARIATQYPGAMADYRHMTGAGRYHIDTNVLDTNHDGFLSREEASANVTLNSQFATLDTNNDGRIATDELRTWIHNGGLAKNSLPLGDALSGVGMASAFQTLDLNGDGRLSSKEAAVQARLGARFRTADSNRDGFLSQAEFDAWANARKH